MDVVDQFENIKKETAGLKEKFLIDELTDGFDPQIISNIMVYEDKKVLRKLDIVELKNQKLFYEYLENYPQPWVTEVDADTDLKECSVENTRLKEEIDDQTDKIEELVETAEESYHLLTLKRQELMQMVHEVEEKISKLNALRDLLTKRREMVGENIPDNVDAAKYQDEQLQKLQSLENTLETSKATADKMKQNIENITNVCDKLILKIKKNNEILKNLHQERQANSTERMKSFQKLEDVLKLIENIGCLKVHLLEGNKIKLEILEEANEKQLQLDVIVKFKHNFLGVQLADVQIKSENHHFEHIIQYAIKRNDIQYLVTQLKEHWLSYLPLEKEISQIQKKFPIDWIEEERILRVIVGSNGRIWCSLLIPRSYPSSGKIILMDIKGTLDGESVEELKDEGSGKNLLQWVDLLEEKFGRS